MSLSALGTDLWEDASGRIIVGGGGALECLYTRDTQLSSSHAAELSVYGPIAGFASGAEHELANDFQYQNTLSIWNKNTQGISAIRFRKNDSVGAEMGAIGVGTGNPPWGNANGSFYLEASDFNNPALFGEFNFVQTRAGDATHSPVQSWRWRVLENGDIVFLDRNHYTSQNAILTIKANGSMIVGSGAIATTSADGLFYVPVYDTMPEVRPSVVAGRMAVSYVKSMKSLLIDDGDELRLLGTVPATVYVNPATTLLEGLREKLVVEYRFDGDFTDSSVSGLNLTAYNSPSLVSDAFGDMVQFTRSSSTRLREGTNATALKLTSGCISAWYKGTDNSGAWYTIACKDDAYSLFLENGYLCLYDWSAGVSRSSGVFVADGNIHHCLLNFRSGVANGSQFYVDGTAVGTAKTFSISNQNSGLSIGGGYAGGGNFINGSVGLVQVFDGVLSDEEIAFLNNSGTGRFVAE